MAKRIEIRNVIVISSLMTLIIQSGFLQVDCGECGLVDLLDPRISGGAETQRGEWPFIAALYYVEALEFFCGGTVITKSHILTAAHCVQNKDSASKLSADDVLVILGAYNLSIRERGIAQRDVKDICVHPDWKVYSDKYDADIAIFVLSSAVEFTNYIRPVCLPTNDGNLDGVRGSIVGWGIAKEKTANLEFPRRATTNAMNASHCLTTDPYVAFISSTRTFCGSGGDGSPNKGDSGGGFFVLSGSRWIQFGIISALRVNASGLVDENSIAVYTNVNLFKDWINEIVVKNGGSAVTGTYDRNNEDMAAISNVEVKRINLDCYGDNAYFGYGWSYSCQVPDLDIRTEHLKVSSFNAYHIHGKSNEDVQRIQFFNGTMIYLPDGIGRIFPRLKVVAVLADLGLTTPRRSNFQNMQNLLQLHFYRNSIERFDEDTLWDLSNLEIFTLYRNKIKFLPDKTFEKNAKLREVDLRWNKLEVLPKDLFKNNVMLQKAFFTGNAINVIQIDFSKLKSIQSLYFNDNVCIDEVSENNFRHLYEKIEKSCAAR